MTAILEEFFVLSVFHVGVTGNSVARKYCRVVAIVEKFYDILERVHPSGLVWHTFS